MGGWCHAAATLLSAWRWSAFIPVPVVSPFT